MKNKKYRFNIGKEARLSMKRFNNNLLAKKWIKLILSVYNGDAYYSYRSFFFIIMKQFNKKIA